MAEPGDSKGPQGPDEAHDHDAQVGFVSPACLVGVRREPEPQAAPAAEPPPEPVPSPVPPIQPAPGLFDRTQAAPLAPVSTSPRSVTAPTAPMSLYAVYVLILLAVPTLGVSAVLALLAVTGRDGPDEPLAAGHFVYQQRTLWSAAVAAVLGGLLVIVNIGVFVLFLLALWVLARGVFGVLRLKAGRPIDNPRSWLF